MGTTFQHTVSVGESPQKVAQKYGISWELIKQHPGNAFITQRERRKAYPLQPGDRLVIPNRELPTHQTEHDAMTKSLFAYLWALVTQHPSYPHAVKVYSMGPASTQTKPKTSAQTSSSTQAQSQSTTKSKEPAGYKKAHPRIWQKVVLTTSIESAFEVLLPYLPTSVVMTSGYRTDADQARIINEAYVKEKGDPKVTDVEQRRLWLKKEKQYKIAKVGSSPHRTGLAFDLSGAKIETIDAAVALCFQKHPDEFPLQSTVLEPAQNCCHVNLLR